MGRELGPRARARLLEVAGLDRLDLTLFHVYDFRATRIDGEDRRPARVGQ